MNLWDRRIKWMLLSIPLFPRTGRSLLFIILFGGMGIFFPISSVMSGDSPLMIAGMIGAFFFYVVVGAFIGRLTDAVFGNRSIIGVLRETERNGDEP